MTAGRGVNSQSVHWGTPPKYIKPITEVLGKTIDLDPCSNEWSIVPARKVYQLPEIDGLTTSWKGHQTIYVNPPYGRDSAQGTSIRDWLAKCSQAYRVFDAEVMALVPCAPNTRHWKESIWGKATALCFLADTRLKFLENGVESKKGAPMACVMVYWGWRNADKFTSVFREYGAALNIHQVRT